MKRTNLNLRIRPDVRRKLVEAQGLCRGVSLTAVVSAGIAALHQRAVGGELERVHDDVLAFADHAKKKRVA